MSESEHATTSAARLEQPTDDQIRVAIEGWQTLTGLTFHRSAQDIWQLAAWFRDVRALVQQAHLDDDLQPATVFMPAGAGPLPTAPREPLRLSPGSAIACPGSEDELAFLPVAQLARLVETRQVSPMELTRLYLDRCAVYNTHLCCVVTLMADAAMEQARAAEAEIMAGHYRGPLHGIPWGIKDLFYTRGVPTTLGLEPLKDRIVDRDAAVVDRLQGAGAILIAKLAPTTRSGAWFGGTTCNPWDVAQEVADGSSAGPASATAAGLVAFSIGQENTGSIVWPSLYCGAVGLRPTFGCVSRAGSSLEASTMDKVGPICRGVEDCAVVFDAIHGPDGKDWAVVDVPFAWKPRRELPRLRVGYVSAEFDAVEDPAQKALYEAALKVLQLLGAELTPVELPYSDLYAQVSWLTNWVEGEVSMDDEMRALWENDGVGRLITGVDYLWLQRVRTLACQDMARLFTQCDVVIYPGKGERCMWATNWTGNPALQLPCGFVDGRPCGLTLVGKPYDEAGVLAAGFAYEQATNWHTQHPVLP